MHQRSMLDEIDNIVEKSAKRRELRNKQINELFHDSTNNKLKPKQIYLFAPYVFSERNLTEVML